MASGDRGRSADPVRALVVEESTRSRTKLITILEAGGDVRVVGQASTASEAFGLLLELRPDIVILDLELSGGHLLVEQIMDRAPTPLLLMSHDGDGRRSPAVVEALVAGALDALPVPERWTSDQEAELRHRVGLLHKVHVVRHPRGVRPAAGSVQRAGAWPGRCVVAIAASTGGPSTLAIVLAGLGGTTAPVLVVQHLHVDFTAGLVDWMSRVCPLPVALAEHRQPARGGHVYLAPSGTHLRLAADFTLELSRSPDTVHRPSADELFRSVAENAGPAAVGVLLTGMGDDGASGLLAIRRHGGRTLAQDEASCAVFGMPAAARRLGAVTEMLSPEDLARAIRSASQEPAR